MFPNKIWRFAEGLFAAVFLLAFSQTSVLAAPYATESAALPNSVSNNTFKPAAPAFVSDQFQNLNGPSKGPRIPGVSPMSGGKVSTAAVSGTGMGSTNTLVGEGTMSASGDATNKGGEKTTDETKKEKVKESEKSSYCESKPESKKKLCYFLLDHSQKKVVLRGDIGVLHAAGQSDFGDAKTFMSTTIDWLIALVGTVALAFIVVGGFILVTAAGEEGAVSRAKDMILYAIIGLVIALLAYIAVAALQGLLYRTESDASSAISSVVQSLSK